MLQKLYRRAVKLYKRAMETLQVCCRSSTSVLWKLYRHVVDLFMMQIRLHMHAAGSKFHAKSPKLHVANNKVIK